MGFLRRNSEYRKFTGLLYYTWRPEDLIGLHEIRPHVSYQGLDFGGFQETGRWHIDSHWEWKNGYEIHTGINLTREGVTDAFPISTDVFVEPGSYDHAEAQLVFSTTRARRSASTAETLLVDSSAARGQTWRVRSVCGPTKR